MNTIRLDDVANPVIVPELIQVGNIADDLPESWLVQFRQYMGIAHTSEDDRLRDLLLGLVNEIGDPVSLGIALTVRRWSISINLDGKRTVYLPRHNGMNTATLDYDVDGNLIDGVEWSQIVQPLRSHCIRRMPTRCQCVPILHIRLALIPKLIPARSDKCSLWRLCSGENSRLVSMSGGVILSQYPKRLNESGRLGG